jgi:hypothetical protein
MKIRLAAPWCRPDTEFFNGDHLFSARIPLKEADALLAWWEPVDELYSFDGPKLFYCAEPYEVPSVWREPKWQTAEQRLQQDEIVRPGHPNPARRIMHDTHFVRLEMTRRINRENRAVAIVSNNGQNWPGGVWEQMELRNSLVTHPLVDLFGGKKAWIGFRRRFLLPATSPRNYRGELLGTWSDDSVIGLSAKYKVAVCLENSCEPYYFTEKFVNAVRSGCIPVYHAHPTVATGILKNARWVDPANYGFDSSRTLKAALSQDLSQFQDVNEQWLLSDAVAETESSQIRIGIASILEAQSHTGAIT